MSNASNSEKYTPQLMQPAGAKAPHLSFPKLMKLFHWCTALGLLNQTPTSQHLIEFCQSWLCQGSHPLVYTITWTSCRTPMQQFPPPTLYHNWTMRQEGHSCQKIWNPKSEISFQMKEEKNIMIKINLKSML